VVRPQRLDGKDLEANLADGIDDELRIEHMMVHTAQLRIPFGALAETDIVHPRIAPLVVQRQYLREVRKILLTHVAPKILDEMSQGRHRSLVIEGSIPVRHDKKQHPPLPEQAHPFLQRA
jgi:hypothetical protein